jgi:hypothetical protein
MQAPGKVGRHRPDGIKQIAGVDDEIRTGIAGDGSDLSEHCVEIAVPRPPLLHGPPQMPVGGMQQAHQQVSPLQGTKLPAGSAGLSDTLHQTLGLSGKLWKL